MHPLSFILKQENIMERVYIYDGYFEKGIKGNHLIRKAAEYFLEEKGQGRVPDNSRIIRPENGKPYFEDVPVKFSLSHSGILWMCMVSDDNCGIDVQIMKSCDYEKLAERFFKDEEIHYVHLWGIEGFFTLWVRKEAFAKCTGKGIFGDMPVMVTKEYELPDTLTYEGETYYFKDMYISDDIKCAMVSQKEIQEEIRML